jgi:hypothetical protein
MPNFGGYKSRKEQQPDANADATLNEIKHLTSRFKELGIHELASDSELDDMDGMELELPDDALWLTTKKREHTPPLPPSGTLWSPPDKTQPLQIAVTENAPSRKSPKGGKHVLLPRRRETVRYDESGEHLGGQDIVYTRCSSPETVHLETDQLFRKVCEIEQSCRDKSGKFGLWGGYCVGRRGQAAVRGPHMLCTPRPGSPAEDPLLNAQGNLMQQAAIRHAVQKMEETTLKDKIQEEFTDHFITQVYNYLSLGYPVMARAFDQELSKIVDVPVAELRRDDSELMANGHFVDEVDPEEDEEGLIKPSGPEKTGEQRERCPRWKALKAYVHEWARQHPNLDTLDPLVWGLQERKGSWAQ